MVVVGDWGLIMGTMRSDCDLVTYISDLIYKNGYMPNNLMPLIIIITGGWRLLFAGLWF